MKLTKVLFTLMLLCGPAFGQQAVVPQTEPPHLKAWKIANYVAMGVAFAALSWDVRSTEAAIGRGYTETDPLLGVGSKPSAAKIYAVNMPFLMVPQALSRLLRRNKKDDRDLAIISTGWYAVLAAGHSVAAIHNDGNK